MGAFAAGTVVVALYVIIDYITNAKNRTDLKMVSKQPVVCD